MTALLLANLHKDPGNMAHAVEKALASLQAVLQASAEASGDSAHMKERTSQVCTDDIACLTHNQLPDVRQSS